VTNREKLSRSSEKSQTQGKHPEESICGGVEEVAASDPDTGSALG
jgi:hypothetical protein